MFRLDAHISAWCKDIALRARLSRTEIEELRDHLFTEVQQQCALGASDQQAFERAVTKLGSVDQLSREYSKNRRIGRAISAFANLPYGTQILGAWLVTIACLMSFTHIAGLVGLFWPGAGRPAGFAGITIPVFIAYALWMWLPFVWGGAQGIALLRGRELGPGRLLGLVMLIALQVPVFGAQPLPAFELSGGLQLTLLLGPIDGLLTYQTLPDIHINAPAVGPHYLGISLIALVAWLFSLAMFVDYIRRNEARIHAAEALG